MSVRSCKIDRRVAIGALAGCRSSIWLVQLASTCENRRNWAVDMVGRLCELGYRTPCRFGITRTASRVWNWWGIAQREPVRYTNWQLGVGYRLPKIRQRTACTRSVRKPQGLGRSRVGASCGWSSTRTDRPRRLYRGRPANACSHFGDQMMGPDQQASGRPATERAGIDLSAYDGKRVALVLEKGDGSAVAVRGTACYAEDPSLGGVLRVSPDKTVVGMPVFVISERDWSGSIFPDTRFGCDVCFDMRTGD